MPLITITCSMGTGGSRIAERVAKGLDLELYDDLKFDEEARKAGLTAEERANLQESPPSFWRYIWGKEPEIYLDLMESVLYGLAKKGQAVIIGHAGQILLNDFHCALHVLVRASEEDRTERLMQEHSLGTEAAEKIVRKADHEQQGFFRFSFHRDLFDPSLYDLILNTAKLKEDAAVQIIMDAARSDAIRECSLQALESMENLAMKKRIEAALLKGGIGRASIHIDVPERGIVHITGIEFSEEQRDRLLSQVKMVRGVKDIRAEISIVPVNAY